MRWRLLRRCLLFGLLGLVTSVAASWGLSAYWQLRPQYPAHVARGAAVLDDNIVSVTVHRATGLYREEWQLTDPRASALSLDYLLRAQARPDPSAGAARGNALAARGPRPKTTVIPQGWMHIQSICTGWPLPGLRWTTRTDHGGLPALRPPRTARCAMLELPWSRGPAGSSAASTGTIALPLEPRPGLAFNTIFYAVLWAGLLLGPGAIRRAHRRARGRCPKCGYSLRGQPAPGCPECGHGRDAPARLSPASAPTAAAL